jgi:hypothetical protein
MSGNGHPGYRFAHPGYTNLIHGRLPSFEICNDFIPAH